MTSYVANHQKKRHALACRERELLRALGKEGETALLAAAEEVRLARIRVFRLELYLIPPCEQHATAIRVAAEKVRLSEAIRPEEVLAEFRTRISSQNRDKGGGT